MIQVGTGGFGGVWCKKHLPPNVQEALIEVVAAVDINPYALQNAREHLGLRDDQLYTDIRKAFEENKADFCTVVVPPAFHESVVDLALEHDLHILSEKPIADTMAGSIRIMNKVKQSGKKMGVTMSHRFARDKTTLREEIRSGRHGALDYLMCRFTMDKRQFGSWNKFRHEIPDALMVEGAVHHLDILADMGGGLCETIYAQTWNPKWGEYAGDSQGLVIMQMAGGARAVYEGAKTNAAGLNGWSNEYIRAECELSTLVMSQQKIERFVYGAGNNLLEGTGEAVPLLQQKKWGHVWLIDQFVHWLDGGDPMPTNVEDNLQSVALIFAAIESSRIGMPIHVQQFLEKARQDPASQAMKP
jgi:predicted dehydrogenase